MTDDAQTVNATESHLRPKPLSLTIGVTGHRPAGLAHADLRLLRHRTHDILGAIQAKCSSPGITALSPLAEGSDQIVARVAIAMGCRLVSVLPFRRDMYVKDFSSAATRAEYWALLSLASDIVELDGSRMTPECRDSAYSAVGGYTIDHSDAILAIWDGQRSRGEGGTGDVVEAALDANVSVVWVSAKRPHGVRLLTGENGNRPLELSPAVIAEVVTADRVNR